jgi:hypothetical protein
MPHRKDVGPSVPEPRDGLVLENVFPFPEEQCRQVVRPGSSAPAIRRPGFTPPPNGNANALPGRGD